MKRMILYVVSFIIFLFIIWYVVQTPSKNKTLKIGSKRFTESYILGEILKQVGEEVGESPIKYQQGLGNTGIILNALKERLIDVYPEYTGTIAYEILKRPELSSANPEELNDALAPLHLAVSPSLGFHNNYAIAMLKSKAKELGIKKISDLSHFPHLVFGFSPEFLGREDGWKGLKKSVYSFPDVKIKMIDHSLSYEALAHKQIDITDVYTTDPKIEKYELQVLEDDRSFFPKYEGVLLFHIEAPKEHPKTWKAFFDELVNQVSTEEMMSMNGEAELEKKDFPGIAIHFLHNHPTVDQTQTFPLFWRQLTGPDFWTLTWQHLYLVFGALIPAIFAGIGLGILAAYFPSCRHLILNSVGIIQTIPSLALLAFLIPLFKQIGTLPALIALFLYSLLPIVRNTYAGLTNIAPSIRDSSQALGLPFFYRLYRIDLPLSSRTILAGVKTAAVLNVGMATIAALIGAGGYGERILAGLALNDYSLLLSGAIPACLLAISVQLCFDFLDYYILPHSL